MLKGCAGNWVNDSLCLSKNKRLAELSTEKGGENHKKRRPLRFWSDKYVLPQKIRGGQLIP